MARHAGAARAGSGAGDAPWTAQPTCNPGRARTRDPGPHGRPTAARLGVWHGAGHPLQRPAVTRQPGSRLRNAPPLRNYSFGDGCALPGPGMPAASRRRILTHSGDRLPAPECSIHTRSANGRPKRRLELHEARAAATGKPPAGHLRRAWHKSPYCSWANARATFSSQASSADRSFPPCTGAACDTGDTPGSPCAFARMADSSAAASTDAASASPERPASRPRFSARSASP